MAPQASVEIERSQTQCHNDKIVEVWKEERSFNFKQIQTDKDLDGLSKPSQETGSSDRSRILGEIIKNGETRNYAKNPDLPCLGKEDVNKTSAVKLYVQKDVIELSMAKG